MNPVLMQTWLQSFPLILLEDVYLLRGLEDYFRPTLVHLNLSLHENRLVQIKRFRLGRELPEISFENNETQILGEVVVKIEITGISGIVCANDFSLHTSPFTDGSISAFP